MTVPVFHRDGDMSLAVKMARFPWLIVLIVGAITAVGAAVLYSSAGGEMSPWADRHILRSVAGLGLLLAIAVVPIRFWMMMAYPAYAVAFVLLALVPLWGHIGLGARRWIGFGGFAFQPSELMKVAAVLALARFLHLLPKSRLADFRTVLAAGAIVALPALLIARQPDLGTAIMLLAIGAAVVFAAGVPARYFAAGAFLAGAVVPFLWSMLHDYQRQRIETFLSPEADPLGAGYHIIQSKIALAAGGMTGKGFLLGTQSKLGFLPEKHTDFVLAMLAEELGFVGAALLLGLFAAVLVTLMVLALRNGTMFGRLVIIGTAMTTFLYVLINAAMVTGLVPVVGVPLPLVSYGGTAMTTLLALLGLAASAHIHRHDRMRREEFGTLI